MVLLKVTLDWWDLVVFSEITRASFYEYFMELWALKAIMQLKI
jgi:hypothetical protein